MQRQGHTRDVARRPAHRCTQSALGDQLQTAQAEQSASSFFTHVSKPFPPSLPEPQTHLCMSPRANLSRCPHHLHFALTLHAPQRADERREWFSLRHRRRRSNNVHIRSSPSLCVVIIECLRRRRLLLLLSRKVLREEGEPRSRRCIPRSDNAPAMVMVMVISVVAVMVIGSGSGKVDVEVFGAGNKSAQVVCEIL